MAIPIRHNAGNWPVSAHVPTLVQGTTVPILEISDIRKRKEPVVYDVAKANDLTWAPGEIKVLEDSAEVYESLNNGELFRYIDIAVMTWIKDPVRLVAAAGIQTVNHYLGQRPQVSVYEDGVGIIIPAAGSIIHVTVNQFTVDLGIGPVTGYILYDSKY